MSYLTELNSLVSEKRREAGEPSKSTEVDPKFVYAEIAREVLQCCIWVSYDEYNDICSAQVKCGPDKFSPNMLTRVDLRDNPVVTVRSIHMLETAREVCFNVSGGLLQRSRLVSDLHMRNSKVIPLAGLRSLDVELCKHCPSKLVREARIQQRCFIFQLEELARRAGKTLSDLIPDEVKTTRSKTYEQD